MRVLLLGLSLAVVLAPDAQAQSVKLMLSACEEALTGMASADTDLSSPALICWGTATGVALVMSENCRSLQDGTGAPLPEYAASVLPAHPSAMEAWISWAQAHPEQEEEPFMSTMMMAFAEAFPCPAQ